MLSKNRRREKTLRFQLPILTLYLTKLQFLKSKVSNKMQTLLSKKCMWINVTTYCLLSSSQESMNAIFCSFLHAISSSESLDIWQSGQKSGHKLQQQQKKMIWQNTFLLWLHNWTVDWKSKEFVCTYFCFGEFYPSNSA